MTRYEVWQLGCKYDKDGNFLSCVDEIKIAIDTRTYHDYARTENESEDKNVYTTTDKCKNCGSLHTTIRKYDADRCETYYEETFVNNLNDGSNKYRTNSTEWVWYKDYSFVLNEYMETINANDEKNWSRYEYIYDWDNFDCTRNYRYTYSHGEPNSGTEECHPTYECKYETIKASTCSQFGREHHYHECVLCGDLTLDSTYDTTPISHSWMQNYETGMFKCYYCGLENANGATGTIVIEDLSDTYGDGTDFVIGYWNKSDVKFVYNLSVRLGEEYDIVLSDIDFTELTRDEDGNGITAITFDKQAAKGAAIAALEAEGCTDTTGYNIRFAFVPLSSDGDLDYAITFTAEDLAE